MAKMSKYIKIPLVAFAAIFLLIFLLLVGVQCVLSEKTLTHIVNRVAVQMVDADVHFGKVKLSLVEKFPRASVTLQDVRVTYPSDRFVEGSSTVDTLASFKQLRVVMKISDLWEKGTIHVPLVELKKPRIFAKNYGDKANWEIFKTDSDTLEVEDTLSDEGGSLPVIHINRVSLNDRPLVVYSSPNDSIFASLRAQKIELRGNIRSDSLDRMRARFSIDSLFVAGRLKKDTVFFGLHQLELSCRPDTLQLKASARAAVALASLGRTRIPMDLDALVVKEDSARYALTLQQFAVSAFDVPVKANGQAWYDHGKMGLDFRLGTADEKRLFAHVKADSQPLEGDDAIYNIDASLTSDLKGLLELVPTELPLKADGVLEGKLSGAIKQSQLSLAEFAKADLSGYLSSKNLLVEMPEDTIYARLDTLDVRLAAMGRNFRQGGKTRRLLALSMNLDTVRVNYKNVFDVNGNGISARAYNSANVLSSHAKNAVHPFSGSVEIKNLRLKDTEGTVMVLNNSRESFSIRPKRSNPQVPILSLRSSNGRFFYKSGADRFRLRNLGFQVSAEMNTVEKRLKREAFLDTLARRYPTVSRDSLLITWRQSMAAKQQNLPDFLSEKDFRQNDLHFSLSGTAEKYFREWNVNGNLSLSRLTMVTPSFPLKTNVVGLGAHFNNNTISLDSLSLVSGASDLSIQGKLDGLKRFLAGRGPIQLDMTLQSQELDCDELLAAWNAGQRISSEYKDSLAVLEDDEFDKQIENIEVESNDTTSSLLVIPANLVANVTVDAGEIRVAGVELLSVNTELAVKERCVRITNTMATSDIGNVLFEGFYSTRTKKDLKVGLNLSLSDVTADKVIELMPAIDSLMPMLSNFSGLLSCDLAVKSDLDTNMNLLIPTATAVLRIEGEDLEIRDSPEFTKLAKILMFKDKNLGYVDHLCVEGHLHDGRLEIFPFVLKMDKYTLAMSGVQNVDGNFKYHVSLIKSPLLFKFGIDLWGNFDDWKFSLCQAKYNSPEVPVFSKVVDDVRIDLSKTIGDIFKTGVDKAMNDSQALRRFEDAKKAQNYVPADQMKSDSLSTAEMEKIQQAQQ